MLKVSHISKEYKTGSLVQKALDDVSLSLRDNEFVAILGPSGSGKTTLLNIIGGLDRYDSGDLIIDGISTAQYKDRDWDSYRNHTIGFVFQSYNLIPHQSVRANVEMALTISGVTGAERRERAEKALERVGLKEHMHKKPNQLSGGQMQRVAIARALINDPDIVLADEPTGALDSTTSVQVMELLKEVAKDRLVVMVTHNPDLAHQYATRIIELHDGHVVSDTDPVDPSEEPAVTSHKNMGKASMGLLTAVNLSFKNLLTKKARTILVAFAGSIGIIGIALILSLSTGVNQYIEDTERETLSEYPLEIYSSSFSLTSLLSLSTEVAEIASGDIEGEVYEVKTTKSLLSTLDSNDLVSLKEWIDSGESGLEAYTRSIEYIYNVTPVIYNEDGSQVNPNEMFSALGLTSSSYVSIDIFDQLPSESELYEDQYEVKAGHWPENENECVIVLTSDGAVSDFVCYAVGLRDMDELTDMINAYVDGEEMDMDVTTEVWDYDDFLGITFKVVSAADTYSYDATNGVYVDRSSDSTYMEEIIEDGLDLEIVGIVQPLPDTDVAMLSSGIWYEPELSDALIEIAADSDIVQAQMEDPTINVLTGKAFSEEAEMPDFSEYFQIDEDAIADAFSIDEDVITDAFSIDKDALTEAFSIDTDAMDIDFSSYIDFDSIDTSSLTDSLSMDALDLSDLDISLDLDTSALTNLDLMDYMSMSVDESVMEQMAAVISANVSEQLNEDLIDDEAEARIMAAVSANLQSQIENGALDDLELDQETLTAAMLAYMTGGTSAAIEAILTEDVQAQLQAKIESMLTEMMADETVSSVINEELEAVMTEVMTNALSDESLTAILSSAITVTVDSDALSSYMSAYLSSAVEAAVTEALTEALTEVMTQYTEAIASAMESAMTEMMTEIETQITDGMTAAMEEMSTQLADAFSVDEDAIADAFSFDTDAMAEAFSIDEDAIAEAFSFDVDEDELESLLTSMLTESASTYEGNLETFGYANFDEPYEVLIYSSDIDSKDQVIELLDLYNDSVDEEQQITYTDLTGTLMSAMTQIVDIISYVLIAFVSISLVVSSIMIGVITYISVLERRKEIGILRAMGASKHNITQVFNAETFITGLLAGLIGVGLSRLLLFPGNAILHYVIGRSDVSAVLPVKASILLVILSVILTMIGGLIPSKKASHQDPVAALRSE